MPQAISLPPETEATAQQLRPLAPGQQCVVNVFWRDGKPFAASETLFAVRMRTVTGILDIASATQRLRPTRFETYREAYDVFQQQAMWLCEQGTLESSELWIEDVSTCERWDARHPEFHRRTAGKHS